MQTLRHLSTLGLVVSSLVLPTEVKATVASTNPTLTAGWREAINDDGIVVYKRKRSGSAYEEVRAETRMRARIDDFLPLFKDSANYRRWVYGAIETRPTSKVNDLDFTFYGVFKIPWPFENRELFSRVEIVRESPENLKARLTDVAMNVPVGDGLVRVTKFESLWSVKYRSETEIDFSIEMYAEPGGNLPPFIVNLVLSRIQLWSIKNLQREMAARKN